MWGVPEPEPLPSPAFVSSCHGYSMSTVHSRRNSCCGTGAGRPACIGSAANPSGSPRRHKEAKPGTGSGLRGDGKRTRDSDVPRTLIRARCAARGPRGGASSTRPSAHYGRGYSGRRSQKWSSPLHAPSALPPAGSRRCATPPGCSASWPRTAGTPVNALCVLRCTTFTSPPRTTGSLRTTGRSSSGRRHPVQSTSQIRKQWRCTTRWCRRSDAT